MLPSLHFGNAAQQTGSSAASHRSRRRSESLATLWSCFVHPAPDEIHKTGPRTLRRTRIEWRSRVIFEAKLQRAGIRFAAELCDNRQTKVDARGDAPAGDPVAIDHNALMYRYRPK